MGDGNHSPSTIHYQPSKLFLCINKRNAARKSVKKINPTDGADLTGAEKANRGYRPDIFLDHLDVMVFDLKKILSPPITRKNERAF